MNERELSTTMQKDNPRIFSIYESVRGKSEAKKDQALEDFKHEVGEKEFHRQMFLFADYIQEEHHALRSQIKEIRKTPDWLFEPWIKLSEVCLRLYGKKDGSATGKFTQKRNGLKGWKPEELKRLEEIRQEMAEVLRPD